MQSGRERHAATPSLNSNPVSLKKSNGVAGRDVLTIATLPVNFNFRSGTNIHYKRTIQHPTQTSRTSTLASSISRKISQHCICNHCADPKIAVLSYASNMRGKD